MISIVENPKVFFDELGGAHDACIMEFLWNKSKKILSISIDNLNSNFLGLPEYQGKRPVDLVFTGISFLDTDIQVIDDQLRVYDIEVDFCQNHYTFDIKCSPGGYFKCQCEKIELADH